MWFVESGVCHKSLKSGMRRPKERMGRRRKRKRSCGRRHSDWLKNVVGCCGVQRHCDWLKKIGWPIFHFPLCELPCVTHFFSDAGQRHCDWLKNNGWPTSGLWLSDSPVPKCAKRVPRSPKLPCFLRSHLRPACVEIEGTKTEQRSQWWIWSHEFPVQVRESNAATVPALKCGSQYVLESFTLTHSKILEPCWCVCIRNIVFIRIHDKSFSGARLVKNDEEVREISGEWDPRTHQKSDCDPKLLG